MGQGTTTAQRGAIPRGLAAQASIAAVLAALISMVVFWPLRRLWGASWGPGDLLSTYNNVGAWGGLWYRPVPTNGYPGEMDLNLFPGIDITQNTLAVVLGSLSSSPFLGLNLLIIISFPITAALAVVAVRLVRLQGPWAIAIALAFTFLPYHWGRSLGHAYLGTTYAAVTGVILGLLIARGSLDRPSKLTLIGTAGLVVVTAWSGVYYAAFGLLVMSGALLWRALTGASIGRLLRNCVAPLAVIALAVLALLPAALTRASESISRLGNRPPYESVELAGSLALGLLPAPVSIAPYMGYYNEAILNLTADAPYNEALAITNYGTWTSLVALLFALSWAFLRVRHRMPLPPEFTFSAFMSVFLALFFVPWGLNSLFAHFISAQIRAWNRLLPILLLFVFLMAASAIANTPTLQRIRISWVGSSVLLVVILIDQVMPYRSLYSQTVTRFAEDTKQAQLYAAAVNAAIPGNCGVIQLPYVVYPENGTIDPELTDYEHFWHSLSNPEKSWSYGAVRDTESAQQVEELSRAAQLADVERLHTAAVCGVHVDLRGYPAREGEVLTTRLESRFGPPAATGRGGDWLIFDTRAKGARS